MLSPSTRIYFWSGIMRDHAEFFLTSLSSRETEFINAAHFYKTAFINIRKEAKMLRNKCDSIATKALVNKVISLLSDFINFKRLATRELLQCNIELGLPPTFVNHMINEAMEFYRELNIMKLGKSMNSVEENILLHKIWLPDAAGHASSIAAELDPTETIMIKEAEKFEKTFNNLFIKARELGQMLERTCLKNGSLEWLNKEVEIEINNFICFLDKIRMLREECKLLGTLKPLIPDHMIREEKYYLYNVKSLKRK
ncbi:hypothetical protein CLPU_4c00200 [Gottschalkia purinilytica]|uniref:DUF2935 domain-containing protein n=1 Tax=Gottschalkia purinilytica TaxID=1503 RepID=A0A0L0WBY6_GOTPU|nr:DUF2935 domain-containing protein [Gottschalkia purinilytica]KNF08974.1 hypothetical protein CLPU_4c00200 [Gottschalkia purinilytica]